MTVEDELTAHQLMQFVRLLAAYCFDAQALRYRKVDLSDAIDGVSQYWRGGLSDAHRQQVVMSVADALPPADAARQVPDPLERVTVWVEQRRATEHDAGYQGALHDLLTQAWRRLSDVADAEPRQKFTVRPSVDHLRRELPVALQYFLAAHDARAGAPLVNEAVLGVGVAAGLVAELIAANRLRLAIDPATRQATIHALSEADYAKATALGDLLIGLDGGAGSEREFARTLRESVKQWPWSDGPPADVSEPAGDLLSRLIGSREPDLRSLLRRVAGGEAARMREYLIRTGALTRTDRGGLLSRRSYRLLEPQLPHAVHSAITMPLGRGELPTGADGIVMELIHATGLHAIRRTDWEVVGRIQPGASLMNAPRGGELHLLLNATAAEVSALITSPL